MFPVHSMTIPVCQTMIGRLMLLCGFIVTARSAALSHTAALSDAAMSPEKMLQDRQSPTPAPFAVTLHPERDLILECRVRRDADIAAVLWTRSNPESESDPKPYVCFYRDGRCDPDQQLQSYEQRVEMADQDLKDGNVSLILRNVSVGDVGTYQCHIKELRGGHVKTSGPICTIRASLEAPEAGNTTAGNTTAGNTTAGNTRADSGLTLTLIVGLIVPPVVLCILVFVCFFHQKKQKKLDLRVLYKALPNQLIWPFTSKSSDEQDPAGPPSKQQI